MRSSNNYQSINDNECRGIDRSQFLAVCLNITTNRHCLLLNVTFAAQTAFLHKKHSFTFRSEAADTLHTSLPSFSSQICPFPFFSYNFIFNYCSPFSPGHHVPSHISTSLPPSCLSSLETLIQQTSSQLVTTCRLRGEKAAKVSNFHNVIFMTL